MELVLTCKFSLNLRISQVTNGHKRVYRGGGRAIDVRVKSGIYGMT